MSRFISIKKIEKEKKILQFEILTETINKKHEENIEEIKLKHNSNIILMETKFKSENDILNQEYLFLSQELEKMRGIQQCNSIKSNKSHLFKNDLDKKNIQNTYHELLIKKSEVDAEIKKIVK